MKKLLFISLLFLILSACAQKLPSYKEGHGMVAVPYHLKNRTSLKFLYTYEWISSEDDEFSVKIRQGTYSKDLAVSALIPAGNYKIDTLVIRSVSQANVEGTGREVKQKIEPPFELYISPGSIMVVPVVYEFEQFMENEYIKIKPNIHNFEADDNETYTDILKKKENIADWKIEVM